METDYISREAVETFLRSRNYCLDTEADIEYVVECLREEIPAADVRPVVPAKWIALDIYRGMGNYKCSACNQECYVPECMGEPMYIYCPNCGEMMGGTT